MDFEYKSLESEPLDQPSIQAILSEKNEETEFLQKKQEEILNIQINLNSTLQNFQEYYERRDKAGIQRVFQYINHNFCDNVFTYDNDLFEIFKHFNFPNILMNLLQYEEWASCSLTLEILAHCIRFRDNEIINFFIQQNLIQILNTCIVFNKCDTAKFALLCLGELIYSTQNQHQKLICSIINFQDVISKFSWEDITPLFTLFFLSNLIFYFRIIPKPDLLINLIKKKLLNIPNRVGIVLYAARIFIEMIKIDNTVLKIIFSPAMFSAPIPENLIRYSGNIFLYFYDFFADEAIPLTTKDRKKILLLFYTVDQTLNTLIRQFPGQKASFVSMKKDLLSETFNSSESLRIAYKMDSQDGITMCLSLIGDFFELNAANFQSKIDLNYLSAIVKKTTTIYNRGIYGYKLEALKFVLVLIGVLKDNLEALRLLISFEVPRLLVESISFDGGEIVRKVLGSISILVDAFQNSVESSKIKEIFISLNLEEVILETNFDEKNSDFYNFVAFVRNKIYSDVAEE